MITAMSTGLFVYALCLLYPSQQGVLVSAGLFGLLGHLKGKYNMIAKIFVPILKKILKDKYGAFIYQVCQLIGGVMTVIGLVTVLKYLSGNNEVDIGRGILLILTGTVLFFIVLMIDDKVETLDKKWENKFKNIDAK